MTFPINAMPRTNFPCLASLSFLALFMSSTVAAVRPHYGGILHFQTQAAITDLDPAKPTNTLDFSARLKISRLIFDSLIQKDANNQFRPALALSWRSEKEGRRWEFQLRPEVRLHDGSVLNPGDILRSLQETIPGYSLTLAGEALVVQGSQAMPDFLDNLAQGSHPVFVRTPDGRLLGTGPFCISEWEPGKRLLLRAHESHWAGRPFLDVVEIQMNRSTKDQLVDFELGRAEVIELVPSEVRRARLQGQRIWTSAPIELMALRFSKLGQAAQDQRIREAIALSLDRQAIQKVLLQKQGEPAAGLLPQWLSGYAFLFKSNRDIERARQLVAILPLPLKPITLTYDVEDSVGQMVADRVAVNCRDAGITMRVLPHPISIPSGLASSSGDLRLVRLKLPFGNAPSSLNYLLSALDLANEGQPVAFSTTESQFKAEQEILREDQVIPLVHLPMAYKLNHHVRNWPDPGASQLDILPFEDVWLAP